MRSGILLVPVLLLARALPAEPKVPLELQVVAAQPAVFMITAYGDYELTYPEGVIVDVEKLGNDVAAARAAGAVPEGRSDAEHAWVLLAAAPDAYLATRGGTLSKSMVDRPYKSGTAFAVSREGILLTNAHVLTDPDPAQIPNTSAVLEMFQQSVQPVLLGLAEKLGGPPAEAQAVDLATAVIDWWGRHCRATGKFRQARMVLKFDRPDRKFALGSASRFFSPPTEITAPLEVLAMGERAPGKDVAVLRARLQSHDRERLKAAGASDDEIDDLVEAGSRDKLICLPLGDSSDVLPGARVQALGFPSDAFSAAWMTEAAGYRVSAREGQIGQTKPVRGGYDMFEMSAGISKGDSGGPVIDAHGRVIAINVGGGDNNATTLAVPINVAREFLVKAGVKPDVGKLTERWTEGLAAFGSGDFAMASKLFDLIERFQGSDMMLTALPDPLDLRAQPLGRQQPGALLTEDLVSPYVGEMGRRAAAKVKAR
ncbi:MAG: serine protease [Planctomycetota bacterium]